MSVVVPMVWFETCALTESIFYSVLRLKDEGYCWLLLYITCDTSLWIWRQLFRHFSEAFWVSALALLWLEGFLVSNDIRGPFWCSPFVPYTEMTSLLLYQTRSACKQIYDWLSLYIPCLPSSHFPDSLDQITWRYF